MIQMELDASHLFRGDSILDDDPIEIDESFVARTMSVRPEEICGAISVLAHTKHRTKHDAISISRRSFDDRFVLLYPKVDWTTAFVLHSRQARTEDLDRDLQFLDDRHHSFVAAAGESNPRTSPSIQGPRAVMAC